MADRIDTKELAFVVSGASGDFACAAEDFASPEAIFEAIAAATEGHTLAHRLATLGMSMAENHSSTYNDIKATMSCHAERYMGVRHD